MKTTVRTCDYTELYGRLRSMRLSGMAEALEKQLEDPNHSLRSFDERISEIITAEWDLRYSKKYNRFLKKASLKYPAADFDASVYDADRMIDTATLERLVTCEWIGEGKNILITGSTGSGKTYISDALCVSALR